MKRILTRSMVLAMCVTLVACLAGCDDDDDGADVDVTGTWRGTNFIGNGVTVSLTQSGTSITGNAGAIPISGSISGLSITLTGGIVTCSGTVSADGTSMSGTWVRTGVVPTTGVWSATKL